MKKKLTTFIAMLALVGGVAFAAVEVQQNGTIVDRTDALNFQNGATLTKSGTTVNIDMGTITGYQTITGDVDIDGSLYTDDIIYFTGLTTSDPSQTGALYIVTGGTLMVSGY
jgi:hypothetical protein